MLLEEKKVNEAPTQYHSGTKWILPVVIGGSFLVLGTIIYLIVKK